jgi:DNA repair exonuclease SbcCD ATPase subunit
MRRIKFKSIDLSYFLSCGEKVSYTFEDGIYFIRGENRTVGQEDQNNGVGKTAIFFDSLVYALYGETSRKKFPKDSIPFNRGGKKKCIVELKLDIAEDDTIIPVVINRTINPSKLTLTVDGDNKTQSNSPATQAYIADTLLKGIKKEVFMQSMATKADSGSFFSMMKTEREKFIGTIFDFTYIKEAEKLAREEFNTVSKKVSKKQTEISSSEPHLPIIKNQIKTVKVEFENATKKKQEQLGRLEIEISRMESFIGDKPEAIDLALETDKYSQLLTKIQTKVSVKKESRSTIKYEADINLSTIETNKREVERKTKAKVCGECGKDIDKDDRDVIDADCKRMVNENETLLELIVDQRVNYKELNEEIKLLEQKEFKVQNARSDLTSKAFKNQKEISDYEKKIREIEILKKDRKNALEDIKKPEDSSILKTLMRDYSETEKKIKIFKTELETLETELEVLHHVKIVFSEKGLRSSILSKLITLFNTSLNAYLMRLGAPCEVLFDEHMEYSMKTLGGLEMQYESFSGGEKWRINMALFLTFSDILRIQNQISFNIKLIDESFDYAVDQSGLDAISAILVERQKEHGENPYIITHKTQFDIPDAKIINVVKEKGQSRIL